MMPELKYSTRNPLGILAMFISFAYLAMVVCFTVGMDKLCGRAERLSLIGFLVLFPFVILGVFYNLITKHNGKLYGPRDYRCDEVFAMMSGTEIDSRNKKEFADVCEKEQQDDTEGASCDLRKKSQEDKQNLCQKVRLRTLYDDLQHKTVAYIGKKLNIRFTENVKATIGNATFEFDAVGDGRFGKYILECKYGNGNNILSRLDSISAGLKTVAEAFDAAGISYRLILAFVIREYSTSIASRIREYFSTHNPGVVTYVLDSSELMTDK